jgi:hypothetical protein
LARLVQLIDFKWIAAWYRSCHFPVSEVGATMPFMRKPLRLLACTTTLWLLLLVVGCSQSAAPAGQNGDQSVNDSSAHNSKGTDSSNDLRPLPFHEAGRQSANSNATGQNEGDSHRSGVPFAITSTATLPVGTLLSVRLADTLSGATYGPGELFTASLDDPVVLNGSTVIPRGVKFTGNVESVKDAVLKGNRKGDHGYVRLTLISMQANGAEVRLQTSSLFARANTETLPDPGKDFSPVRSTAGESSNRFRLQKGRFLTFRLLFPISCPAIGPAQMSKNSLPNGR